MEVLVVAKKDKVVILSRDAILQADDLERELVPVPEWGGSIYVRALSGAERDAFETSLVKERTIRRGRRRETTREMDMKNLRARLCALTICDADGKRLFTDDDIADLGNKSAAALQRVFEVAQRLSGLTDDDVDELVGNSDETQGDDSTSD